MPQLDFSGIYPRTRSLPEQVTIGAIRIGKGIDNARRIGLAIQHPRGRLEIRPSRSEEHTSELQSLMRISYAVFCLKKKQQPIIIHTQYKRQKHQHNDTIVTNEATNPHRIITIIK